MDPFSIKTITVATIASTGLAYRAVKRKSLTMSGAIVGFITSWLMVCCGLRGMELFYFYQLGSWATKYKLKDIKMHFDASVNISSSRNAIQVLCVSIIACILSLYHAIYYGSEKEINFIKYKDSSTISTAILAHHCTGLADTLASELGILSKEQPILITKPWKYVPHGTNGGITLIGCLWSCIGGSIMSITMIIMDILSSINNISNYSLSLIIYGCICGLLGSIIDSLLGATIQITYYDPSTNLIYHSHNKTKNAQHLCGINILTNEQVNLLSTAITVYIGGWILAPMIIS